MADEKLVAKVKAVNRANEEASKMFPLLAESLKPFLGKQVIKKEGGLLEKVKKVLPALPNDVRLQVFRHTLSCSLAWTVKTCEMIGQTHTCLYHEVTVYVGELDRGVLVRFESHPFNGRTDYTAEEVESLRAQYAAAKKLADIARNNLHPFGEYDN